ncbi:MAG: chemotaxis protein CheA [Deltaproteobacteria bacterium]|nr:chemotaxis protein CheA [Deltaproteobacteria bacterium]
MGLDRSLREFIAEATEIVEHLEQGLAVIHDEKKRGKNAPAMLNEVFRHAHSLKGLAGMFGVETMGKLAHQMESLLDGLRLGKLPLDDDLLEILYACADAFSTLLAAVADSRPNDPALAPLVDGLVRRIQRKAGQTPASAVANAPELQLPAEALSALTEYEEHRLKDNLRNGVPLYRVHAPLPMASFESDLGKLTSAVQAIGELVTSLPSTEPTGRFLVFDLLIASPTPADELNRLFVGLGAESVERIDRSRAASMDAPASTPAPMVDDDVPGLDEDVAVSTMRQVTETVRVDIKKLDELMGVVGELVLARGGLTRVTNELKSEIGFRGIAVDLHRLVRTIERRIVDLQLAIMQVRMVPLGQVFDRLARAVKRTAQGLGKDVELLVGGEETELDKLIVEDLVDPLMHLVRNAIDHGLESPEARVAVGKPRRGTLELRAYPRGNHVVIDVIDDGRGIDEVAVKRTALDRGLVDEEHIGQLSRREVWNLIFLPGFSTRKEVSAVSGRGVGLDVVKTNISRLSGLVDVDSVAGKGTRFTITLPMTLAIIQAVIVKSAHRVYALPLASVLEMVAVTKKDLCTVEGREMITLRGQTLPLLRLDRVFHPGEKSRVAAADDDVGYAAVVGLVQHRAALLIDDVLGQQDIVIKTLGAYLQGVRGIAGATHLGDHETILVLDVGALMEDLVEGDGALSIAAARSQADNGPNSAVPAAGEAQR